MTTLEEHNKESEAEGTHAGLFSAMRRKLSVVSSENNTSGSAADKPKGLGGLLRRRSTFKNIALSMTNTLALRRPTRAKLDPAELPKPTVKYENTYKLKPDEGKVFNSCHTRNLITNLLNAHLKDIKYDADNSASMACDVANMVKNHMKQTHLPRYKFVCQAVIGQCKDQGVEAASRAVWDTSTDNYTCVSFSNESIFAFVIVHAIYFE